MVTNKNKLDQLCSFFVSKFGFKDSVINDLCEILPNVDHFDFFKFKQQKLTLEEMKIKALKIDRRFIVTSKDMVEKGVPLAYFVQAEIISQIIDEFNLKNPNSKVDP